MEGYFLVWATRTRSVYIVIVLLEIFMVALFWYIQDKERSLDILRPWKRGSSCPTQFERIDNEAECDR